MLENFLKIYIQTTKRCHIIIIIKNYRRFYFWKRGFIDRSNDQFYYTCNNVIKMNADVPGVKRDYWCTKGRGE